MTNSSPAPQPADTVLMPRQLSPVMQTVWRAAFHAQLLQRRRQRRNPAASPASAEAVAYAALVWHSGVPLNPAPSPPVAEQQAATAPVALDPCPFCGGEAEIERVGNSRQSTLYVCTDCGCRLETGEEWGHGRLWNRRTAQPLPLQPVSTAPTDGTPFLGFYYNQPRGMGRHNGQVCRCWWEPAFNAFISSCREMQTHNGYQFADGSTRQLHSPEIETPTHWCPLPDVPADAQAEGEAR